jgi:cobalamin biosynthesis protein CbiD
MSKWYAIKGPDGEWLGLGNSEAEAWANAGYSRKLAVEVAKSFGMSCVEVEIVEAGAADKLTAANDRANTAENAVERIREAWLPEVLRSVETTVDVRMYCDDFNAIARALNEVEKNADGGEKGEGKA